MGAAHYTNFPPPWPFAARRRSEEELQQEGLPAPAAASPSKRARVESQQKDIAEVGVSAGGAEAAV
jgi:hypothetical protein